MRDVSTCAVRGHRSNRLHDEHSENHRGSPTPPQTRPCRPPPGWAHWTHVAGPLPLPTNVLEVASLLKQYRTPDGAPTTVVDVPTFVLGFGEQLALRGASGSGKTTFLNLLAGILEANEGTIWVAQREFTGLGQSARDRARARTIGCVFQTFNLLQGYSALENVRMGMMFGRGVDERFARELLKRVGLGGRMNHRPQQLSVGQQQRVAVARALAGRPKLVLADEPTGSLDARRAAETMSLIRELCREQQAALLTVSHDRDMLAQFESVRDFEEINRAAAKAAA